MNYIIFGGSGFIGTHLIHLLKNECLKPNDKIYDLDIVMPGEEGVVPGIVEKNDDVEYIRLDVRKTIEFGFKPTKDDVIFNLAAVHRTPGHPDYAYFETNIYGAENVTAFAEKHGIQVANTALTFRRFWRTGNRAISKDLCSLSVNRQKSKNRTLFSTTAEFWWRRQFTDLIVRL